MKELLIKLCEWSSERHPITKLLMWIPAVLVSLKITQLVFALVMFMFGGPTPSGGAFPTSELVSGLTTFFVFVIMMICIAFVLYEDVRDCFGEDY